MRRWPLQQTNTTQRRARLPPLGTTMEAFRRQVSGTGAKKKKPEPVTRDAYGFVVRTVHRASPHPTPRRAAPPTLLFHLRLGTPRDVSPSPRPVLTARVSYPYRRSSRSTWTRTGATRRCTSPKKPSAPSDGTPSCRRAERRSLTHRRSRAMSTQTETQPRARPPQHPATPSAGARSTPSSASSKPEP